MRCAMASCLTSRTKRLAASRISSVVKVRVSSNSCSDDQTFQPASFRTNCRRGPPADSSDSYEKSRTVSSAKSSSHRLSEAASSMTGNICSCTKRRPSTTIEKSATTPSSTSHRFSRTGRSLWRQVSTHSMASSCANLHDVPAPQIHRDGLTALRRRRRRHMRRQ